MARRARLGRRPPQRVCPPACASVAALFDRDLGHPRGDPVVARARGARRGGDRGGARAGRDGGTQRRARAARRRSRRRSSRTSSTARSRTWWSLVDREPATAKRMIERLIVLLRAAASGRAPSATTLAEQVDHARAYLDLVALRIGAAAPGRSTCAVARCAAGAAVDPAAAGRERDQARHRASRSTEDRCRSRRAPRRERLELEVADTGAGLGPGTRLSAGRPDSVSRTCARGSPRSTATTPRSRSSTMFPRASASA